MFSSSNEHHFLHKVFKKTFLTWELVDIKYFFQKTGFCVVINLLFEKVVMSLLAFFALSKTKQNFRNSHTQFIYKIWTQLQILLKNFLWNFQNTFFAEDISVFVSWIYIIVSTLSFKIGLMQIFLNNILDSQ